MNFWLLEVDVERLPFLLCGFGQSISRFQLKMLHAKSYRHISQIIVFKINEPIIKPCGTY